MKEVLDSDLIELSVRIPGFTGKLLHSSASFPGFSRLHFFLFSVRNEDVPRLCRIGPYQSIFKFCGVRLHWVGFEEPEKRMALQN